MNGYIDDYGNYFQHNMTCELLRRRWYVSESTYGGFEEWDGCEIPLV